VHPNRGQGEPITWFQCPCWPPPKRISAAGSKWSLTARENFNIAGRPPNYRTKRTAGFVLLGTGFGTAAVSFAFLLLSNPHLGPHGGDAEPSHGERVLNRLLAGAMVSGSLLGVGGLVLLGTRRRNAHRQEIGELNRERDRLRRELKRTRKAQRQLALVPNMGRQGLHSPGVALNLLF
jgi:hypothetical protein